MKYGLAAPVPARIIRHTPHLDGLGAPPSTTNFAGGGDLVEVGNRQARLIKARTALNSQTRVLDLGAGIGRLALQHEFRRSPHDDGLEIVRLGTEWCRRRLALRFHHADLFNSFFNPFGRIDPEDYAFPFVKGSFDLIFATSVLTRLDTDTIKHYLTEAARCLATGGTFYFTYYRMRDALCPDATDSFHHSLVRMGAK